VWFGIIYYEFEYVSSCDSVCIKAVNQFIDTKEYLYSRGELQELYKTWNEIIPVYRKAIRLFPKEINNGNKA